MSIHDDIVSLCDPSVEFDYDRWGRVHDHLFRRHYWLMKEYYKDIPGIGPFPAPVFERHCRIFLTHASVLSDIRACKECGEAAAPAPPKQVELGDFTGPFFIYELFESDTQKVRYVGQTRYPDRRLYAHRSPLGSTSPRMRKWIKRLQDRGATLNMVVVGQADTLLGARAAEEKRIWELLSSGVKLLNKHL